jgi:hypothetical protein
MEDGGPEEPKLTAKNAKIAKKLRETAKYAKYAKRRWDF